MTFRGHIILATSVSLPFINAIFPYPSAQFYYAIAGVILGALLPDIDEPGSYIGRKIPIISFLISFFVKHRGFTHTIFFALIPILFAFLVPYCYFCYNSFYNFNIFYLQIFLFFIGVGCILHDIGDMLTKSCVKFFYPISNKTICIAPKSLRFRTGSIEENIVVLILFVLLTTEISLIV
ncbi:metal-dependent hydrolase [Caminibacter pacificus]|uniref:Inner membrane protein n=1 Tax=Caminibacter pacificus TaxID=1424653 RepID=A0AAJ4RAZ9_9BACT|nr:metal-dependent hydrolase [Caminibacter pacificus]QDD68188.1 metal-dependent hydrolase [Caminibacter pacificus]ROR38701.1 inner membrane protein [Caminibacter pacificus]